MNFRCLYSKSFVLMLLLAIGMLAPDAVWSESFSSSVRQPVNESIDIRLKTQQDLEQWDEQRRKLVAEYEMLQSRNAALIAEKERLTREKASHEDLVKSLEARKKESLRISSEITPFIENAYSRIQNLVAADSPFLRKERQTRLKLLEKNLHDPQVSVSEKFRKVMEALFVEAEYGNTIEVYQDKVNIEDRSVLGNIFRMGRVSLFFQSLDQKISGYFDVAESGWRVLPEKYNREITAVLEMGAKHRPVDLVSLPLGRIEVAK